MNKVDDGKREPYIARGPAPDTFVVRPIADAPPVIPPAALTAEQTAANEELYRRFRTAFAADVQVTVVDAALPEGVLARLYRARGAAKEPGILVSRQELSIDLLFAARHALASEIARRPEASPDEVLVLTRDVVVVRADGTTHGMEVMRRAEETSADDATSRMLFHLDGVEPTVSEGMTVRTLRFSELVQ